MNRYRVDGLAIRSLWSAAGVARSSLQPSNRRCWVNGSIQVRGVQPVFQGDVQPSVRLSAIDISPDRPQRALVFLHGFGGKAIQWIFQLQKFSLENRVIAIDLRGHGHSDKPTGQYKMSQIIDDLRVAFNVLAINDKVVLLGHSFGGAVAAEFAAKWPERVERLVLVATAARFKLNPLYRFALHLPLWLLRMIEPFTHAWLGAPPHVMKPWYWNNLVKWDGMEVFSKLCVPTTVNRGYRDLVFERSMFEEVARAIPHAEDVDIGASGHMVTERASVTRCPSSRAPALWRGRAHS